MCFSTPQQPRQMTTVPASQPLPVANTGAIDAAAQREVQGRRRLSGFAANLVSSQQSRQQGSVARTLLLGR